MMKYIILMVLVFCSSVITGQNSKIFLLMSYVDDFDRDTLNQYITEWQDYKKVLFKVDSDTLVAFDTINVAPNHNMDQLIQYSDKKFFYIEEKNMYEFDEPNIFTILDYSREQLTLRRFNSDLDNNYYTYYSYLRTFYSKDQLTILNENETGKLYGYGRNKYFEKRTISLEDYQKIYRSGISSPYQFQPSFKYQYPFIHLEKNRDEYKLDKIYQQYAEDIGDTLKIAIGFRLDEYYDMPTVWIQIPKNLRDSTIGQVSVLINNDSYFVGSGNSKMKSREGFPTEYIWIYNKSNNRMDTIQFNGKETYKLKVYEDWLYGTSELKNNKHKRILQAASSEERHEIYVKNKESVKGKYNLQNGKPPFLLDKTGNLFLYHIPTKKKIKWNTGNVDSELLLIRDNVIYYRVYDEIRSMELDNKELDFIKDSRKVIAKNQDIIPYVHHIFFSSSSQEKCKEVWINNAD